METIKGKMRERERGERERVRERGNPSHGHVVNERRHEQREKMIEIEFQVENGWRSVTLWQAQFLIHVSTDLWSISSVSFVSFIAPLGGRIIFPRDLIGIVCLSHRRSVAGGARVRGRLSTTMKRMRRVIIQHQQAQPQLYHHPHCHPHRHRHLLMPVYRLLFLLLRLVNR